MELYINDRIRNRKVKFFNQFSLSLRYDAVASSFAFSGFFNPDNIEHKELYCVGHYHEVTVVHDGELLLTGYMLSEAFNNSSVNELAQFGGYSKPGFLEDCQIPPDIYPLQSTGLSLRQIAAKLIKPFGLTMSVDSDVAAEMDAVFPETTAEATQTIKDYLTTLCAQKGVIISHNERGHLLFTRARTNRKPIIDYDGSVPFTKMSLSFNGQQMHSHIYVLKEADENGGNAGQSMIRNPYVPFVYRPKVIVQSSGDDNDTEKAARMALSAELKGLKLTIVTDRWDIGDTIIKPNNTITVINPDAYIFKKTKFFIEEVAYAGNESALTATLTCSLPEVYNNQVPEYIYKGINLH